MAKKQWGYTTNSGIKIPKTFKIKGYKFTYQKDGTMKVINPGGSTSYHISPASALYQRGFKIKDIPGTEKIKKSKKRRK